jgi:hypothetical protein
MRHLAKALMFSGLVLFVTLACADLLQGQSRTAPTADEIVRRMLIKNDERQTALEHYRTDRTYQLEYDGTGGKHHAEMIVRAEYQAPGRKNFTVLSESGSKLLCREVLRRLVDKEEETSEKTDWQRAMFSAETYTVQLVGREQLEGMNTWVLKVEPKVSSKVAYRGKVWVSMDDFAMVRVMGEPARSPSWMLDSAAFDSWYMRRGDVWVPAKNISTTHVRIGGEAKVTIDYGKYDVLLARPIVAGDQHGHESASVQSAGRPLTASLAR